MKNMTTPQTMAVLILAFPMALAFHVNSRTALVPNRRRSPSAGRLGMLPGADSVAHITAVHDLMHAGLHGLLTAHGDHGTLLDHEPGMWIVDATRAAAASLDFGSVGAPLKGVDKGWFGTGLLKGVDPWTAWRSLIQGSIGTLHDALDAAGVKKNTFGWSIILFTFTLRTLTLPLTWLQFSSTEKQKALQPKMKEIKDRFPNDSGLQNALISKLYEDTDSNPLAGCLPPLFQIPVFIAMYRSVLNLANAKVLEEPFFFLPSLEGPTLTEKLQLPMGRGIGWLTGPWEGSWAGGDLVPPLGWHDTLAYCAIPLVITLTQFAVQKLTAPQSTEDNPAAQRTQAVLKYIPLMIGYFSLCVPSALNLYWLTSNMFTGVATVTIRKYWEANPPVIDWDLESLNKGAPKSGLGSSMFQLAMPANMDEALADARLNARPPRTSRRLAYPAAEVEAHQQNMEPAEAKGARSPAAALSAQN